MSSASKRLLGHRLVETAGTLVFAAYALSLAVRLTRGAETGYLALAVAAGIVTGHLLADLISGIAHWIGDRFFNETTPFIGVNFIAPFRRHHVEPREMVEHGLVELVGNTAILAMPALALVHHTLDLESRSAWMLFAGGLALSSMAGSVSTNIFHRWAHMERPPRLARRLQAWGLVITPERHALHHSNTFDSAYCITTGWLNGPMDHLRTWERLERCLGCQKTEEPSGP